MRPVTPGVKSPSPLHQNNRTLVPGPSVPQLASIPAFHQQAHHLALMTASPQSIGQGRPEKLDPLPGIAKTQNEVMNVYRLYPWIFTSLWPLTLLQQGTQSKEEILKEAIRTIQKFDLPIFNQSMQFYPQGSFSFADPLDGVIERVFENTMEWDIYFKRPLSDHYFGGIKTRHVESWRPSPSEALSPQELQKVQNLLDSIKELRPFIQRDAWDSAYFERLARVIYPRKFRYQEPSSPVPQTSFTILPNGFRLVSEPEFLPSHLRIFAQRTFSETTPWLQYDSDLHHADIQDIKSMKRLWGKLQGRTWSGSRLRVSIIDALPIYETLLRKIILEQLPSLQKIRVISREARQEKNGTTYYRLVAVEDYDVLKRQAVRTTQW